MQNYCRDPNRTAFFSTNGDPDKRSCDGQRKKGRFAMATGPLHSGKLPGSYRFGLRRPPRLPRLYDRRVVRLPRYERVVRPLKDRVDVRLRLELRDDDRRL